MQHNKMHTHGLGTTMVPGLSISYFGFHTQMKKVNLHFRFEGRVCCVYLFNRLHYRPAHSWCLFLKGRCLGPVMACWIWLSQVGLWASRCSVVGNHVKGSPGAKRSDVFSLSWWSGSGTCSPLYTLAIRSSLFFSGSSI